MRLIKNKIPFDKLILRKYANRSLTKNIEHTINGLDTETLDGYCKLICDDRGNYLFIDSIELMLKCLVHSRYRNAHNFFFNLNYDVNAIIKYLPKDNLEELANTLKTTYEKYKLFYIPKKLFRINHCNHSYSFYDIAQFFDGSLDYASQKFLGKKKFIEKIDRATLGTSASYWKKHHDSIIKYCINDAKLTQELAQLLHDTLSESMQLIPQKYISKASITKDFARKKIVLPDIRKLNKKVLRFAFNSYSGGRFEIIKKGYVGKCILYDIVSAYPYHISNLIDVSKGEWRLTSSLHENATYGFYLVKLLTHYNNIAPIPLTLPNQTICYPIMETGIYLTKEELLAYDKYIDYEIITGYEFYTDTPHYLCKNYIQELFTLKQNTNSEQYEYNLYKILMNALYGCFYEKYKKDDMYYSGKLFNPIYATMITANTRIQLFELAMQAEKDVVGFATDSILFQNKPDISISKDLGAWDIQSKGKSVVLRSGMYKIGKKIKNRGLKKATNLKTPHGEYSDIFKYIKKNPKLNEYPIILNRPLTFKEVLAHSKKRTTEDINIFTDIEYKININKDHKRLWDDVFINGGELFTKEITSSPLVLA